MHHVAKLWQMGKRRDHPDYVPVERARPRLYKLILVGDAEVGKTNLITRLCWGRYSRPYRPTIGADFVVRRVVLDGTDIALQIWDVAGQERFSSLGVAFYRGADGFILVYDVTREETLENLNKWIRDIEGVYGGKVPFPILIGNKCDLTDMKVVDYERAKDFADEKGMLLVEVSACDGTNVELAIMTLVTQIQEQENRDST